MDLKIPMITCLLVASMFSGTRITSSCMAQDIDYQYWVNYALSIPITNQLSYGGDIGIRGQGRGSSWNQALVRPTITYQFIQPIGIAGAVAWFGTFDAEQGNTTEFRIHQDLKARWPDLGFIQFLYRIRLEQRFFYYEDESENDFSLRPRGLIGIETRDFTWFGVRNPVFFQCLFEVFTAFDDPVSDEIINQTRLHFAFGHRISPLFRYEIHYIPQQHEPFNEEGPLAVTRIFRLRLFHRLQLREQ